VTAPPIAAHGDCEGACARLTQAFVAFLDDARYEAVAGLFMPDGVLHRVSGEILSGRAEIAGGLRRPEDQIVIHHASPVHVERIADDQAAGMSSFLAFAALPGDQGAITRIAAVWRDHYHRTEGRWLISERRVDVRFSGWRE